MQKCHNVAFLIIHMKACVFWHMLHFSARKKLPGFSTLGTLAMHKLPFRRVKNIENKLINGPGKREDSHLGCLAFDKNPGAFVHGRAGGENIIDQEYLLMFYFFWPVHHESVSDISAPFSSA